MYDLEAQRLKSLSVYMDERVRLHVCSEGMPGRLEAASACPSADRSLFSPLTTTGCVAGRWLESSPKPTKEAKVEEN